MSKAKTPKTEGSEQKRKYVRKSSVEEIYQKATLLSLSEKITLCKSLKAEIIAEVEATQAEAAAAQQAAADL